jgi:dihydrofolate reductase
MLSILVAADEANGIGKNNQLIWHIPDDLKRFKALTMGRKIIMGRKTYDSIGRPLPGRDNIVVSRQHDLQLPGCTVVQTLEQAMALTLPDEEAFVIGGSEIYRQLLPLCKRLYLTRVFSSNDADAFFPEIDDSWLIEKISPRFETESGLEYQFIDLFRSR